MRVKLFGGAEGAHCVCACVHNRWTPAHTWESPSSTENPDSGTFLVETWKTKSWRNWFRHCVNSEITGKIECGLHINLKAGRLITILNLFSH